MRLPEGQPPSTVGLRVRPKGADLAKKCPAYGWSVYGRGKVVEVCPRRLSSLLRQPLQKQDL